MTERRKPRTLGRTLVQFSPFSIRTSRNNFTRRDDTSIGAYSKSDRFSRVNKKVMLTRATENGIGWKKITFQKGDDLIGLASIISM